VETFSKGVLRFSTARDLSESDQGALHPLRWSGESHLIYFLSVKGGCCNIRDNNEFHVADALSACKRCIVRPSLKWGVQTTSQNIMALWTSTNKHHVNFQICAELTKIFVKLRNPF
jgi:hypothetical protein